MAAPPSSTIDPLPFLGSLLIGSFILSTGPLLASASPGAAWDASITTTGVSQAQIAPSDPDSLTKVTGRTLVVTATRSEKALEDVAAPISVISSAELRSGGLLRLDDALLTLPGLTLFEDHGSGVQLRGFSPEYTLILLDGEPLIGRNAGTLDLARVSMKGVERIEVVEGPTSSLYGSEALAGVVNIISASPRDGWTLGVEAHGASHSTVDLSTLASYGDFDKGIRVMANQLSSDGFDLHPDEFGTSAPAFTDRTLDARGFLRLGQNASLKLGARLNQQEQQGRFAIRPGSTFEQRYDDLGSRSEWSLSPSLDLRAGSNVKMRTGFYHSGYQADVQHVNNADGSILYQDEFHQTYSKLEQQVNVLWNAHHLSIVGLGGFREALQGDRYRDQTGEGGDASGGTGNAGGSNDGGGGTDQPVAHQFFTFLQHEWIPREEWQFNLSGRYDAHSDYASRWTPKLSVLHRVGDRLSLRASIGSGFKAPAFRQLYLAFSNSNAGYSVFGSTRLQQGLARLMEQGVIEAVFLDPDQLRPVKAEQSVAYNLGFSWQPSPSLRFKADVFHNDVRDLIETQPIAMKTNGQYVFTYFNLSNVYTRGLQTSLDYTQALGATREVGLTAGWQFIQSRDLDILRDIQNGVVFGRDLGGQDYLIRQKDYLSLFGRSPYLGTLTGRFQDTSHGLSVVLTGRWRSAYGYRDLDGNGIANRPDERIPGHLITDVTFTHVRHLGDGRQGRAGGTGRGGGAGRGSSSDGRGTGGGTGHVSRSDGHGAVGTGGGSQVSIQAGVRNLTGRTFPDRVPSLSGRLFQINVRFDVNRQ